MLKPIGHRQDNYMSSLAIISFRTRIPSSSITLQLLARQPKLVSCSALTPIPQVSRLSFPIKMSDPREETAVPYDIAVMFFSNGHPRGLIVNSDWKYPLTDILTAIFPTPADVEPLFSGIRVD